MATTIVAALVVGAKLVIASLGDSRAYMIRKGKIQQITRDHSLVQKLVDEGSISPQEAEDHPRRNVVLRSLGVDARIHLDLYDGNLQSDDVLVLCSDGLTRHVKDAEIAEIATSEIAEKATRRLVNLANAKKKSDKRLTNSSVPGGSSSSPKATILLSTLRQTVLHRCKLDDGRLPPGRRERHPAQ